MAFKQTAQEAHDTIFKELGQDIVDIFKRDDWSDLQINPDGSVWLDTDCNRKIECFYTVNGLCNAALTLAAYLTKEFNFTTSQQLDGTIPLTGIRAVFFNSPVVKKISCIFRRLNTLSLRPSDLIEMGSVTKEQSELIIQAILEKKNIIFAGATGSGKTTMMNAFLTQIPDDQRVMTVEDTEELDIQQPNYVNFYVNNYYGYQDSIAGVLRSRPDRLIVGELRYGEQCLQTLKLFNTGHPGGMATIHANDCDNAILRMRQLCQEVSKMDAESLDYMILGIIDLIIFIVRVPGSNKRYVKEIAFTSDIIDRRKKIERERSQH